MTDAAQLKSTFEPAATPKGHGIPFGEAVRVWARIASLSFGGPAGQIAVMHRILVDEKRWIGEERFLHALNYCMLLPGPEAQQLAVYIGWLLHKTKGGLVAGALFVLPGFLAILGLSYIYVLLGQAPIVTGLFFGLKAAVLAIVLQAVVRVGGRALKVLVLGEELLAGRKLAAQVGADLRAHGLGAVRSALELAQGSGLIRHPCCASSQRSASIAALQPLPAAVTAWR